jgi:type 1 glutamine amidotransferase
MGSVGGEIVTHIQRFATRYIGRRSAGLLIALLGVAPGFGGAASLPQPIDCPLRDEPYSIDSPLIDVLLKPEAKAVVEREMPQLLQRLPPRFFSTTPPSFAAIISLRTLTSFKPQPQETLAPLNQALAELPVTAADRAARCARYDIELPHIVVPKGKPRLLLFEKITGFRDLPSVEAAEGALRAMAERNGWALVVTDKGGSVTPATLKKFDAVIWNNVSGDVLTLTQRRALRAYIEGGGGFVGFHGSGGDSVHYWDWYTDILIGARFAGHPMAPQFQDARIIVEAGNSAITRDLAPGWTMNDEWYSFKTNPRTTGAHVIAALDETSYSPKGPDGQDLSMGDHPIAWTRCVGNGRSFYSAIGHRPETYSDPRHVKLLEWAIAWAAGTGETDCRAGISAAARRGQ